MNIIAKSVGTLIAAYLVRNLPGRASKVILCGIPSTSDERLKIFQEAFKSFPAERVIVYQNERDPFKTPAEIKEFMSKVNPAIKVNAMQGAGHNYPYYEDFNKFLI